MTLDQYLWGLWAALLLWLVSIPARARIESWWARRRHTRRLAAWAAQVERAQTRRVLP